MEKTEEGSRETIKNENGKVVSEFDKEGQPKSLKKENADGSKESWQKNADGSETTIKEPDADHKQETVTRRDETGTPTRIYDKDHNLIGQERQGKDGAAYRDWEYINGAKRIIRFKDNILRNCPDVFSTDFAICFVI